MLALAVQQQLVVDVRQQEFNTPAFHTKLVLHQHYGTAVVASLWTRDHTDLITEGAESDNEGEHGKNITVTNQSKIRKDSE